MFRLQDNVPEIYVEESRDFQLFCRLYDSVFGGVKFSIDSLQHASCTKECHNSLLELLKTKVGLFSSLSLSDEELRTVLEAFPLIMRYKGSERAIKYIINLFYRITKDPFTTYSYFIINEDPQFPQDHYTIQLRFSSEQRYNELLMELLRLVLPTGYNVSYEIVDINKVTTQFDLEDELIVYPLGESRILASAEDGGPQGNLTSNVGLSVLYKTLIYPSYNNFPEEGEPNVIYLATDTQISYVWTSSQYIEVGGTTE